jgi:hypothetical protein
MKGLACCFASRPPPAGAANLDAVGAVAAGAAGAAGGLRSSEAFSPPLPPLPLLARRASANAPPAACFVRPHAAALPLRTTAPGKHVRPSTVTRQEGNSDSAPPTLTSTSSVTPNACPPDNPTPPPAADAPPPPPPPEGVSHVGPSQPALHTHAPEPDVEPSPLHVPCSALQGAQGAHAGPACPASVHELHCAPPKPSPQVPHVASPAHAAGQGHVTVSRLGVAWPAQGVPYPGSMRHTPASTTHASPHVPSGAALGSVQGLQSECVKRGEERRGRRGGGKSRKASEKGEERRGGGGGLRTLPHGSPCRTRPQQGGKRPR